MSYLNFMIYLLKYFQPLTFFRIHFFAILFIFNTVNNIVHFSNLFERYIVSIAYRSFWIYTNTIFLIRLNLT
nr:MAG TPA: hypothetical protein [Caudoviricetes sp.]